MMYFRASIVSEAVTPNLMAASAFSLETTDSVSISISNCMQAESETAKVKFYLIINALDHDLIDNNKSFEKIENTIFTTGGYVFTLSTTGGYTISIP